MVLFVVLLKRVHFLANKTYARKFSITFCRCFLCYCHVIGICLPSQSASEKHNQEKSPPVFAHLVNFSKNVSTMFDNHTISLFLLWDKQTFCMFSLRDLRFVLCSRDLDVLRTQRIIGFKKKSKLPRNQRGKSDKRGGVHVKIWTGKNKFCENRTEFNLNQCPFEIPSSPSLLYPTERLVLKLVFANRNSDRLS